MCAFIRKALIFIWVSIILQIFIVISYPAFASDPFDTTKKSDLRFGISAIYSPKSFIAWGKIKNSRSLSFRGQIWHSRVSYGTFKARLGSEIILAHHLHYPINGDNGPEDYRFGIGVVPVNIFMPFSESRPVNPFTFVSAGGILLNDKFPKRNGASINYLINLGAGIEMKMFRKSDIQFGYILQHMSNANTGQENPGIDSHMFFFSILI